MIILLFLNMAIWQVCSYERSKMCASRVSLLLRNSIVVVVAAHLRLVLSKQDIIQCLAIITCLLHIAYSELSGVRHLAVLHNRDLCR